MLERPWVEQARVEADPRTVIALLTAYGRAIMTRVGAIMKVVRDAAAVDTVMEEQWATNQAQTELASRVLAEQLEAMDALRVPVDDAVAVLLALSGIEVYLSLAARGLDIAAVGEVCRAGSCPRRRPFAE